LLFVWPIVSTAITHYLLRYSFTFKMRIFVMKDILKILHWLNDKTNLKYINRCKPHLINQFYNIKLNLKFIYKIIFKVKPILTKFVIHLPFVYN